MTEQKPLTEMSLIELKAMAYDQIGLLERCQQNLQIINTEIAKRQEQPEESVVPKKIKF